MRSKSVARSVVASCIVAGSTVGVISIALAQRYAADVEQCRKDGHPCVVFELAKDVLPQSGVKLANGFFVRALDWQAVALANFSDGLDAAGRPAYLTCTASIVGTHSLLTAAHCVDIGEKTSFRKAYLVVDNRTLEVSCDPDPRYFAAPPKGRTPRNSFDFALCEIKWDGQTPPSLQKLTFETVDADTVLAKGTEVVLTGYGCTDLRIENHRLDYTPNVGSLRIGQDAIAAARSGTGDDAAYVITRSSTAGKEPALCPGDSGGPLISGLRIVAPATADGVATLVPDGDRRIRGVNSSIDFEDRAAPPYDYLSRMAALAGTGFREYAKGYWAKRHAKSEICGITPGAKQCTE